MAREDDMEEVQEVEERLINEEFKIWKKNCPWLYGASFANARAPSFKNPSSSCLRAPRSAALYAHPFPPLVGD